MKYAHVIIYTGVYLEGEAPEDPSKPYTSPKGETYETFMAYLKHLVQDQKAADDFGGRAFLSFEKVI